jgi:hypothetical protein
MVEESLVQVFNYVPPNSYFSQIIIQPFVLTIG